MNSKLKAAIIGYGYMGEIRHRMVDQHDSVELVMICDNDTSKIKSNPDCKIVMDPSDVINSDVDIVFICTQSGSVHCFLDYNSKSKGCSFGPHCQDPRNNKSIHSV